MSNQNIRSLLRAELSTRRITHPHASYANSKSSLLSCTVCHLVIKSESLWEGHLRSANHRRNVQRLQQGQQESGGANGEVGRGVSGGGARKRKADSMDEDGRHGDDTGLDEAGAINGGGGGGGGGAGRKRKAEDDVEEDGTGDGRKKTKAGDLPPSPPRPPPLSPTSHGTMAGFVPASTSAPPSTASDDAEAIPATEAPSRPPDAQHAIPIPTPIPTPHPTAPSPAINEDEYAAFEREVLR
ncbi:hypothetical protein GJ744_000741 [Endocarpon pusillum]|uniref:U1-type domain-containing protein n=1 Tax=Endocarpon pusillum TaxID=364733 RepID=A0A8H7DZX9_9EURO|nr:hypothetical protein GJ744_000741 [Endocarpon pusillum]